MKWLTFKVQHRAGFRFNLSDFIFLIILCSLSGLLYYNFLEYSLYLIPLYLVFSFFLFCNVFRIGNRLEAFWYIPFTILALYCLFNADLDLFWKGVLFLLEPIKWGLIVYAITKDHYRGIFSKSQHFK